MNYKHKIAPWSNMTWLVFLAGLIVMALMLATGTAFADDRLDALIKIIMVP